MDVCWQVLKYLSDFINESSTEHLVSLVEDDDFQEVSSQGFLLNQILYSSRSSDDDLDAAAFQGLSIFPRVSSTDAASRVDFDELTEAVNDFVYLLGELSSWSQNDGLALRRFWVDQLKNSDRKCGSFACS